MIQVFTKYPVAIDSPDYLHPWGTIRDNTKAPKFWEGVRRVRKDKISYLDLGCAGGGLVVEAHEEHDYDSAGLEGSDYWVKHINDDHLSANQWKKYHNQRLFTCDISRPFSIFESGKLKKFDLITAWEVLEHLPEDRLLILFDNINKHLTDSGIFVGTVCARNDSPEGIELHQTIRPYEWWNYLLQKNFQVLPPDFDERTGLYPARIEFESIIFLVRKRK